MRRGPAVSPPEVKKRQDDIAPQVRQYELITPLFGGGTDPGEPDPVTPVSGKGIRGQLRFWWRACRAGRYMDLRRMKEDEDLLWGASSTENRPRPSQVQLEIETISEGTNEQPYVLKNGRVRQNPDWIDLGYAAFPLQPPQGEKHTAESLKSVRIGVSFKLRISYPRDRSKEVEAALWAWETFGGVGGRTRRGFGAVRLISIGGSDVPLPRADQVESQIRAGLERHVVTENDWPEGVPHLSRDARSDTKTFLQLTGARKGAVAAWEDLISKLKSFRQARYTGTQPNRPGRSRWPEPDAIRRLTRQNSERHRTSLSGINSFPRAAFGLPIIFHFKDENNGDPEQTKLEGPHNSRLASPLILRPLACANEQAVGMALILQGPPAPPGGLALKGSSDRSKINFEVRSDLTPAEAKQIAPLDSEADVLQAFLRYVGKETR